jgi:hypothetical protein
MVAWHYSTYGGLSTNLTPIPTVPRANLQSVACRQCALETYDVFSLSRARHRARAGARKAAAAKNSP